MRCELGPVIVWASQVIQILASYYLYNALIVAGRKDVEWTMRNTLLQSQTISIVGEVAWSAFHPKSVSTNCCIACALLFTVLQTVNLTMAFGAVETSYSVWLARTLQCVAGLAWIPVSQLGNNYTLEKRISPARYRTLGFVYASSLALAVLLTPVMASPFVTVSAGVSPPLFVLALLVMHGTDCQGENDSQRQTPQQQSKSKATIYVGGGAALMFVFLGCATGTIGEALIDMALTLILRKNLKAGRQDLPIANQVAVIFSMLMAYWTETRPGGGGANKAGTFILAWCGCQVFRSCCMNYLEAGGVGVLALFVFVFIGRYVGPLGKAAQDTALLKLLKEYTVENGVKQLPWHSVPATLLWTMRQAVSRLERPLCQLILLNSAGLPVSQVASLFAGVACIGVLAIVRRGDDLQSTTKKDN
eukprot:TRINITY_DN46123_c0_g1_i1.p1 TRINITY_DN46123_c0_g1~~TRINITY_DN46123_c0_g1_i1.p1  ORF type:complete len:418 (-),score=46.51 TRINITY_DN46123_c0_g1_i1:109-1362(-)